MKKDSLYGPPKEMFETKKSADDIKKLDEKREYKADDDFYLDENDDGKNLA